MAEEHSPEGNGLSFNISLLDDQRLPRICGTQPFQRYVVKVHRRGQDQITTEVGDLIGSLPYPHATAGTICACYQTTVEERRQCLEFELSGVYDEQQQPDTQLSPR